jgi:ABC-type polysaccharide/polyol phosphate transport system ATPase subunit
MLELMDSAHILIFVSHNLNLIRRLTKRCIWLDKGTVVRDGVTEDVCRLYERSRRVR